jgi:hypothetical protein
MRFSVGPGLVLVSLLVSSPIHAAPSLSCTERFQAAGIDSSRLSPGDHGRLEGYEFIVARGDTSAQKICDRVDAEKGKTQTLQSKLDTAEAELSTTQDQVAELKTGGVLKDNYLIVEGGLLAWAVIASIWVAYFVGRLNSRHHL